jgi:hypothetical protein
MISHTIATKLKNVRSLTISGISSNTRKFTLIMDIFRLFLLSTFYKSMEGLSSFQEAIQSELEGLQATGQEITWQIGIFYDYRFLGISYSKYSAFKWLVLMFAVFTVIFMLFQKTPMKIFVPDGCKSDRFILSRDPTIKTSQHLSSLIF